MQGGETSPCEPSVFDEYDKQEGYIEEVEVDKWEINRKMLYYIYHYAIHLAKCSYAEAVELELAPFIDFLIVEIELQKEINSI